MRAAGDDQPSGASRGERVIAGVVAFAVTTALVVFGSQILSAPDAPPGPPALALETWEDRPAGFSQLPDPPLANEGMLRLWGDGMFFIWGGQRHDAAPSVDEGHVFDPSADAWHAVSDAPLRGRSHAAGVWTGSEFLIWGGGSFLDWPPTPYGDGAAYDPRSDTWREIAPAPIEAIVPAISVWTGSEMVVWGDLARHDTVTGAAYDPVTDAWRVLPPAPRSFEDSSAVWTGTDLIVFGSLTGPSPFPETGAAAIAYSPEADAWRKLPDSDLVPNSTEVAWDGERLVAMDYSLRVQTFDVSADRWLDLPRMPANACEGGVSSPGVVDGRIVTSNCGELIALEPGAERWRVLLGRGEPGPLIDYTPIVAADDAFLIPGWERDGSTLWLYRPMEPDDARHAVDVAAAFAAIRSHYPFSGADSVQPWIMKQFESLVAPRAAARYDDSEASGLTPLWAYYWGFEIKSVEPLSSGRSAVVVRFEQGREILERLTIGPGIALDGLQHDMVVLDAEPVRAD
jgi:hypothetical protein